MDRVVKAVLSGANKEQNMHYPPHVFESHFNTVSDFLIDECVRVYPTTQSVVDVLRPFLVTTELPIVGGKVALPDDYRNLLRVAVNVTEDFKNDCGCTDTSFPDDPLAPTAAQVALKRQKANCISHVVRPVDTDEWDDLTTHPYKKPTLKKPICNIFEAGKLRVCPHGLSHVEITYVRKPKEYVYGYQRNPDDTYFFDLNTSVESEWDTTAHQYLTKGLNTLYSMYVKDGEMRDWNQEIKQIGLF